MLRVGRVGAWVPIGTSVRDVTAVAAVGGPPGAGSDGTSSTPRSSSRPTVAAARGHRVVAAACVEINQSVWATYELALEP